MAILFQRLKENTEVCKSAGLKKISRFVLVVDGLGLSSLGLFEAD